MSELNLKWPANEPHYVQLSDDEVVVAHYCDCVDPSIYFYSAIRGHVMCGHSDGFLPGRTDIKITHDLGPVPMPKPKMPALNLRWPNGEFHKVELRNGMITVAYDDQEGGLRHWTLEIARQEIFDKWGSVTAEEFIALAKSI